MSREQEAVAIIDRRTGNSVTAILHKELDELELIDVEIVWAPERLRALRELRQKGVPANSLPQHVHWNWALKAVRHSNLLAFRSFGIEADGKMQGLMMVCFTGKTSRLDPDKGKPLVYVDFVETAPWNAKEFTGSPIYKGVGVRLIQAARGPNTYEQTKQLVGETDLMQILETLERLKNQSVRWRKYTFCEPLKSVIFKAGELHASLDGILRPSDRFVVDDNPLHTIAPVIMRMSEVFLHSGREEQFRL